MHEANGMLMFNRDFSWFISGLKARVFVECIFAFVVEHVTGCERGRDEWLFKSLIYLKSSTCAIGV